MNIPTQKIYNKYLKYKNKYLKYKNKYLGQYNIKEQNNIKAIAFFKSEIINGTVKFEEISNELVNVKINLNGFLPNSIHGFHVHETGDLSNGCESLCAHFNPYGLSHGDRTDNIRHIGDLGNIYADNNGIVQIEFTDHMIKLQGDIANIIGRGLIIHENEDDCGKSSHELSKTTGNSGSRIACSIIGYASSK